jgi:hypothetical protein
VALNLIVEDEGLQQAAVQSVSNWDSGSGEYGAVEPPGEKAADNDNCAQHTRRTLRTWRDQPTPETSMGAEPANNRRVDGMIDPVSRGLMCEEHAQPRRARRARGRRRWPTGTAPR